MNNYTHTYMCGYTYTHIHIYICVYLYIYIYIYTYAYMYMYVYIYIYIYTYACMYVCMYVCIYACMIVCICMWKWMYSNLEFRKTTCTWFRIWPWGDPYAPLHKKDDSGIPSRGKLHSHPRSKVPLTRVERWASSPVRTTWQNAPTNHIRFLQNTPRILLEKSPNIVRLLPE